MYGYIHVEENKFERRVLNHPSLIHKTVLLKLNFLCMLKINPSMIASIRKEGDFK